MTENKNIVICASWYPSSKKPSEATFIEEQTQMWIKKGFNVTVLHCFLNGGFKDFIKGNCVQSYHEEFYNDVRVVRIGVNVFIPFVRGFFYKKLCLLANKWLVNHYTQKPLIIHSHSAFLGGLVANFLSKENNIPYIHTEHTSGFVFNPSQYNKTDYVLLKKTFSESFKTYFVSSFSKKMTLKNMQIENSKNYDVLFNIVNPIFFDVKEQNNDLLSIFCIGNFIERKGHKLLFDSWKIILTEFPNARLTLCGEGELYEKYVEYCKTIEINHSIKWKGRLDRLDIKKEIDSCSIVVSTSIVETFGLSLAEAMASGKPVVSINNGGCSDFIKDFCGVIVNERDPNIFAKSVVNVWENYDKYNILQISAYAKASFSENIIMSKILDDIDSII